MGPREQGQARIRQNNGQRRQIYTRWLTICNHVIAKLVLVIYEYCYLPPVTETNKRWSGVSRLLISDTNVTWYSGFSSLQERERYTRFYCIKCLCGKCEAMVTAEESQELDGYRILVVNVTPTLMCSVWLCTQALRLAVWTRAATNDYFDNRLI